MKNLLLSCLAAVSLSAVSASAHGKTAPDSKEFARIKALVGEWKGTSVMEGKTVDVASSFKLTANGSAVLEVLGAGTPHEMVNVYHDVDGKLVMTHYCAAGNAPLMKLVKADMGSLSLAAVDANGIDVKKTPHMHSLVYSFEGPDKIKTTWTSANMGHDHEKPAVFEYKRAK